MDKELSQATMATSKLQNKILGLKNEENKIAYVRSSNQSVIILRWKKRGYYNKLNIDSITDNIITWKTVRPLFSDKKLSKSSKITNRHWWYKNCRNI